MRDVARRNWRFWLVLAEVLVLTAFFAHYIGHRQTLADQRAERQRQAICAILSNIPGHIPAEIARARVVFARHPGECQPISRPTPKPTPAATVTVTPTPRTVVQPGPTVTHTARPASHPSATSTKQPSPSPSPSRTCVPSTSICTH